MQRNNVLSPVVEEYISINKSGVENLLSATRNEFNVFNGPQNASVVKTAVIKQVETDGTLPKSSFSVNPDSYYKTQVSFGYNSSLDLTVQNKVNDIKQTFLWNYHHIYPVTQVNNADTNTIAYTSFEADDKGNFNYSGAPSGNSSDSAVTGKFRYSLAGGNITRAQLDANLSYIVSYWSLNGPQSVSGSSSATPGRVFGNWTYYEHLVNQPASGTITISGTGMIDELRLYPSHAKMVTYTYNPLIGITSQCDADNHITYYYYDEVSRLTLIRDQDKNIIKKIRYNRYDHPESNGNLIFYNSQQSQAFTRNNCAANYAGSSVTYTVNYGSYTSSASQTQADSLASADILANGQNYANTNGTCTIICNSTTCTGVDKKCVYGTCETGSKIYTASTLDRGTGLWTCTYHYQFSDCSITSDYTETSASSCTIGTPCR
jgi:YD repeat-containing protein